MTSGRSMFALAIAILLCLVLAACNFAGQRQADSQPTEEPSVSPGTSSKQATTPQVVATSTPPPTATEPQPDGPPTAAPPELGEVIEVEELQSGLELTITMIHMSSESQGWAIGGPGGNSKRVLITEDGGSNWREVTPPLRASLLEIEYQMVAVFMSEADAQILRYQPQPRGAPETSEILVVWRTEDGGNSWTASEPLRIPFLAVEGIFPYWSFGSQDLGWILARRGGAGMHQHPVALLRSEDGGSTWSIQQGPFDTPDQGLSGCTKTGMAFGTEQAGLLTLSDCPLEGAEVLSTTDGGESWQSQLLPAPAGFEAEYQQAAGGGCASHSPGVLSDSDWYLGVLCRVFAGSDESRYSFIYRTDDAGVSWRAYQAPEGELQMMSADRGWVLGREIYSTADGGQNWQLQKKVFWDGQFSFIDMEQGWAVARSDDGEIALVRTQDGGQSWQILEPIVE